MMSLRNIPRPVRMSLLVALFGLIQIAVGERMPFNEGFGWDGCLYRLWVIDFSPQLFTSEAASHSVTSYCIQRILPSAVVHYALRLAQIPLDWNRNPCHPILMGFLVLNAVCLTTAAYVWALIAARLKLPSELGWLGLAALFLNYGVGNFSFFYAPLTDTSAFLLGTLTLYFALERNRAALLVTSVIGAFVWPLALPTGLLLYVFDEDRPARFRRWADRLVAHGIPAAYCAVAVGWAIRRFLIARDLTPISGSAPTITSLVLLSLGALLIQAYVSMGAFLGLDPASKIVRSLRSPRLLIGIGIFAAVRGLQHLISIPDPRMGVGSMFSQIWSTSVTRPFLSLLSNLVYFGPIIYVVLLRWPALREAVREQGRAFPLAFAAILALAVNCESRQLIFHFPFLAAFAVKALEGAGWGRKQFVWFGSLSFLSSKIWLRYTNEWPYQILELGENFAFLKFPRQYYFMNQGPWMSNEMYLAQGLAAILGLMALVLVSGPTPSRPATAVPGSDRFNRPHLGVAQPSHVVE